ncbi:MAG: hypothetical protein PHR68_01050 [Candidatus Gracilibacteria bacterium]|nr:hypothetical protein [Candidatus Gracilibacteria bacterium]
MENEMEHKKGDVLYYPIKDFGGQHKRENGEVIELDKMQVYNLLKKAFPEKEITVNADENGIISIDISDMETIIKNTAVIYTDADENGCFDAIYLHDGGAYIAIIKA